MSKILSVVLISLLSACASKTIQPTSGTGTEGSSVATAPPPPPKPPPLIRLMTQITFYQNVACTLI